MLLLALALALPARAAPTVEEEALRAALEGRKSDAVRILERTGDPRLRWLAGRYALVAGEPGRALQLFPTRPGDDLRAWWGHIDAAAASGDLAGAAKLALEQMDLALAGAHRLALTRSLRDWAAERAARDDGNAQLFLRAALGIAPDDATRRAVEEALFLLDPDGADAALRAAATRQVLGGAPSAAARLYVAVALARTRPGTAATQLGALVRELPRDQAVAAARALVILDVPDPLVLEPLAALGERFPRDKEIDRLRLDHALAVAARDEALGDRALDALAGVPALALDALEARARVTTDAARRRARWLDLAALSAGNARGEAARRAADEALLAEVREGATPEARRTRATAALGAQDLARTMAPELYAELAWHALAGGPERTAALRELVGRAPSPEACAELAGRLVTAGAGSEDAGDFVERCGEGVEGATPLDALAVGVPSLVLLPSERALTTAATPGEKPAATPGEKPDATPGANPAPKPPAGALTVLATGATALEIREHAVDAEALLRATEGHPLDATLDAFLLEPDRTWTLPVEEGRVKAIPLRPRGRDPLTAVTVRAGDQRATALVVADPLDVQVVRAGPDAAIATLRAGAPVAADLLVQDGAGAFHRGRTDASGVTVLHGLDGAVRILARRGAALGFATAAAPGDLPTAPDAWSVDAWDRAVPAEGAVVDVQVFGTRPHGDARGGAILTSLSADRRPLASIPLALVDGAAHARIFAQGEGFLVLEEPGTGRTLRETRLRIPSEGRSVVTVRFEPPVPRVGERFVARVNLLADPGPGGLAGELTVTTPWSEARSAVVLGGGSVGSEGSTGSAGSPLPVVVDGRQASAVVGATGAALTVPIDLAAAAAGDPISVVFTTADGRSATGRGVVQAGAPGALSLPTLLAPGVAHRVASTDWLRATSGGRVRWTAPGADLALPEPGIWEVCAWREQCGPATRVTVTDGALDADGRWTGAPVLSATTGLTLADARLVRPGEPLLPRAEVRGTSVAWLNVATAEPIPVAAPLPPAVTVGGTLRRGAASTLEVTAPAGARVWAFVRDAGDGARPSRSTIAPLPEGTTGEVHAPWAAPTVWGETIAAGLLDEEERLAEATDVERMDFGFSAADEKENLGDIGTSGYGAGGGAGASHTGYGTSGGTMLGGMDHRQLGGDPRALAVVEGRPPGSYPVTLPAWIAQADVEVVVRTADGRWATTRAQLDVGGEPLARLPAPVTPILPAAWDGSPGALLAVARTLPPEARAHALAALAKAGVAEALPAYDANASIVGRLGAGGPSATLARFVLDRPHPPVTARLDALPDTRRAERAEAALTLAGTDPDRAAAAAARLLREPDLAPWIRARAGLALLVAGNTDEARVALADGSPTGASPADGADADDAPVVAAARAVAAGRADPAHVAAWWATARAEGALPADRALAVHALTLVGRATAPAPAEAAPTTSLALAVEAPLAAWRGRAFTRGTYADGALVQGPIPALSARVATAGAPRDRATPPTAASLGAEAPADRDVPVWITVPASPLPSRLACPVATPAPGPADAAPRTWIDLPPAAEPRAVSCHVRPTREGTTTLTARWYGPDGRLVATGDAALRVLPARDSTPTDAMSPAERFGLGQALAAAGDPAGVALLDTLLRAEPLPRAELQAASAAVLQARRARTSPATTQAPDGSRSAAPAAPSPGTPGGPGTSAVPGTPGPSAPATPDPRALVEAFQAYRERVPDGALDLDTAAALAHAYAALGDSTRALAAARTVLDARFKEELGAVAQLQEGGLALTASKLLRELVDRYPEVPTVVTARYLAPSMLLARAEGDGDRLGYTRSSLRHTAAAELAAFLLLHPDADQAPEAAAILADALHALGDPDRERALAGPLARRYRAGPAAWRLALADARATLAAGRPADAARVLAALDAPDEGAADIELERGRVFEALGRLDDARAAYEASGLPEAWERAAWLDRATLVLPTVHVVHPGDPGVVRAWLRPGTEVTVTAVRVALEAALLRDGGALDPASIQVAGLRPAATRTARVGTDGDVPLPSLPDGAYVLLVEAGGLTGRTLLVRTDAELSVVGSEGTLVHLSDLRGAPLPDAQLWLFDGSGEVTPARTDGRGAAWVPYGGGMLGVLARHGDRYALANLGADAPSAPSASPAPARGYDEVLQKNEAAYDGLFQQEARQRIDVSGL